MSVLKCSTVLAQVVGCGERVEVKLFHVLDTLYTESYFDLLVQRSLQRQLVRHSSCIAPLSQHHSF